MLRRASRGCRRASTFPTRNFHTCGKVLWISDEGILFPA
jgi:hypothetical protein